MTGDMEYYFKVQQPGGTRLIPLDHIVEVAPMVELKDIDGETHPDFAGVMLYRGHHIPVYDLQQIPEEPEAMLECLILIVKSSEEKLFGLRSLDDCEVLSVADEQVDFINTGTGITQKVVQMDEQMIEVWVPALPENTGHMTMTETRLGQDLCK